MSGGRTLHSTCIVVTHAKKGEKQLEEETASGWARAPRAAALGTTCIASSGGAAGALNSCCWVAVIAAELWCPARCCFCHFMLVSEFAVVCWRRRHQGVS